MNSNFISTESINKMDMTELVCHIEEFVFFKKKTMKEGQYKNTQDMLKRLYEIAEEKTFKDQCKKYSVVFIEVCPVINLPLLSGRSDCRGLEGCCQATEVRIKYKTTAIKNVFLHPLLVDFLNGTTRFQNNVCASDFNLLLKDFLRANSDDDYVAPLARFLCIQFDENIQTIIDAAETQFEFSEKIRCASKNRNKNGETRKTFKVEKKMILHKILETS